MTRYDTIVFDLDGTLVDSYEALTNAINYTRGEHGLAAISAESIRGLVGDGLEPLLERVFAPGRVPPQATALFEQKYDELCCGQSVTLHDVEPTLAALDALGIRMAVCTNKPTSFSTKILDHLGIAHYFAAVVGPDLAGARKPDGAHVRATLAAAGGPTGRALFVGDMTIDVAAARNGGLPVAVIATGSNSAEALRAAEPDYFLNGFSDLVGIAKNGATGVV
jgi:phosphoglycolate phosphatase